MSSPLQPFFIREVVIKAIRSFFDQQSFHEVITPVLNDTVPLESTNHPFFTEWQALQGKRTLYLSTSPERGLKKMLGMGIGNCYTIGKSFRNLENTGAHHNPEFLMLEWYRTNAEYHQIVKDVVQLFREIKKNIDKYKGVESFSIISYQDHQIDLAQEWQVLSLEELFKKNVGVSLADIQELTSLQQLAQKYGYKVENATWEQLFNQLLLNEIEPHLPTIEPYFLIDFPVQISPLCKPQTEKPYLAERFEVFMFGMELGNGNTELIDSQRVQHNFQQAQRELAQQGYTVQPIDQQFLDSLQQMTEQQTSFAGIGMGVERIAMIFADVLQLQQVEPFYLTI